MCFIRARLGLIAQVVEHAGVHVGVGFPRIDEPPISGQGPDEFREDLVLRQWAIMAQDEQFAGRPPDSGALILLKENLTPGNT